MEYKRILKVEISDTLNDEEYLSLAKGFLEELRQSLIHEGISEDKIVVRYLPKPARIMILK